MQMLPGSDRPSWTFKHPRANAETLGIIPFFLSLADPRPAKEQFDSNYVGGWRHLKGFTMTEDAILFPGDPPMPLLAETRLRDETIRLYASAWVAIVQPDGTYEISRMD